MDIAMTRILCAAAIVFLIACAPAQAQLTPVYGWLRTALENTMAQALPPYGKAKTDKDPDKSVAQSDRDTAANDSPAKDGH
jgi:hypothetical protein